MEVVVIRTGVANLASVVAGLRRVGAEPVVSDDAATVAAARRVLLPGVGAFAPGMESLRASGLARVLATRIAQDEALMTVCLGLQLLATSSDESPGVTGIGVIDAHVHRFPRAVVAPQLGWNAVKAQEGSAYLEDGYAYYANSYRLDAEGVAAARGAGWKVATSNHGGHFAAAMERGKLLACQFHPELSGAWGGALTRRWLEAT